MGFVTWITGLCEVERGLTRYCTPCKLWQGWQGLQTDGESFAPWTRVAFSTPSLVYVHGYGACC